VVVLLICGESDGSAWWWFEEECMIWKGAERGERKV
jgi:hypothetical protein